MTYRPEVDGLRAVAVLAVLVFHAVGQPTGGFVGVDVFFVISGYVITAVLTRDLETGRYSIAGFYERRIRRIAPALFVTIAATSAAAAFLLLPPDLDAFGESVRAAVLMVANIQFWKDAGYFEAAAQSKPLLHVWSLAIEEQFYLAYPLLLAVLWRRARRAVVPVLAGLCLLSFMASVWMVARDPSAAFYLAPFRAWELLFGALAALRPVHRFAGLGALAGVGMIAASFALTDEATSFPGLGALPATLGAALVINGAREGSPVARSLSLPPVVFVGKISYSLYLVHWPLIVLTEYRQGAELGFGQGLAICALSIAVAAFSWAFVEQPFRKPGRFGRPAKVFLVGGAAAAALVGLGSTIDAVDGLPGRLPPEVRAAYEAKNAVWKDGLKCWSDTKGTRGPSAEQIGRGEFCRFGPQGGGDRLDYLVWGDSHAAAMTPAIREAADRAGARGGLIAAGNCPPLADLDPVGIRPAVTRRCHEINAAALDYIRAHPPARIFMVGRWARYASGSEFGVEGMFFDPGQIKPPIEGEAKKLEDELDKTLETLKLSGAQPIIVLDVIEPGHHVPYAFARARLSGATPDVAPPRAAVEQRQRVAREIAARAAEKRGAEVVDPRPLFCDAERCRVETDGTLLFSDHSHISLPAAHLLSGLFEAFFASRSAAGTPPDGRLQRN